MIDARHSDLLFHRTGQTDGPVSVYFDRFDPPHSTGRPIVVMVHGGAHSGACYLHTANGESGWAYEFVRRGYPVVVPDWPGIGRSGSIPLDDLTGEVVVEGLSGLIRMLDQPVVLMVHSMSGCYGWRLAELHGAQIVSVIGVTPSQPGNIQDEAKVLNETDSFLEIETLGRSMRIDKTAFNLPSDETILKKYIGDSKFFPRDRIPAYKASLLGLAPRILAQRRNIRGSQVRLSDPSKLAGQKVLVVTGTADIDHPRELDESIVTWLNSLGAKADFYYLGDHGIEGNGHMLMLETNSSAIASLMLGWLETSLSG